MDIKKSSYEEVLHSIKEHCRNDDTLINDVSYLEECITFMYDTLKCHGLIKDKREYTREEVKKLNTDDVENLFSDVINEVVDVYAELSKTDSIEICLRHIEFFKTKSSVGFTFYNEELHEYVNCTLTEDEFFNNDLTKFRKRFKSEYVFKKEREIKNRMKELVEENFELEQKLHELYSLGK